MKFWKGNRLDGEYDMPVTEVAAQFAAWYKANPDEVGGNLERELRYWLTSKDGLDSVWVDEGEIGNARELADAAGVNAETFAHLYDKVIDLVY